MLSGHKKSPRLNQQTRAGVTILRVVTLCFSVGALSKAPLVTYNSHH